MNRMLRLGGYSPPSSRVTTSPKPTGRKVRVRPSGDGGPNNVVDRITCTICGFPGIDVNSFQPGQNFPTVMQASGSTYVWTSPDQPLSVIDKTVTPVPQPTVSCPFCGGTFALGGRKGKGQ